VVRFPKVDHAVKDIIQLVRENGDGFIAFAKQFDNANDTTRTLSGVQKELKASQQVDEDLKRLG
jgi:histidinol dehydrogenase